MAIGSQSASSRLLARPSTFQRTQPSERHLLFGQLLRSGPSRSGPIFDRLDTAGVAQMVALLQPAELALLTRLVLSPERVGRAATLDTDTLVTLMRVASANDAMRLYANLSPERSRAVRSILCERMAQAAASPQPEPRAAQGIGMVLRLRRLFRR